jgi:hypothetical protein
MGLPKMRKSTAKDLRCAAMESPYGPAPIMQTEEDAELIVFFVFF